MKGEIYGKNSYKKFKTNRSKGLNVRNTRTTSDVGLGFSNLVWL